MKFSCQSCHAKYSIPDERVENKVVRLACQKCGAEIVVRGPVSSPALTQPPPAAAFRSTDVDDDEPEEPRETTRIANLSELETMRQRAIAEAAEAKAAEVKKKAKPPPPPADHDEELREWMTLVQSEQRGPFTVEEILAQTRAGALHEKSYVWKEGMPEWQRLGALAPFKSHFGPKPMPRPSCRI